MGELLAALVEAVAGLITAFLEAVPAIVELLLYILAASVTIIAYAISPNFRRRKRQEWSEKPNAKYLDLGISCVCLVSLICLAVWINWQTPVPAMSVERVRVEEANSDEDVRLKIKTAQAEGGTNGVTIAVKRGGTRKILETDTIQELRRAISENLSVVHSGDRAQDSAANGSQPIPSETNSRSSVTGSSR